MNLTSSQIYQKQPLRIIDFVVMIDLWFASNYYKFFKI